MRKYSLSPDVNPLLSELCRMTEEAGDILMRYWRTEQEVTIKDDLSPVTQADIEADRHIVAQLKKLRPEIAVVSEEGPVEKTSDKKAAASDICHLTSGIFFLVDPLDGTKSFIRGGKNFTVNIGLIENKKPVMGVILIPAYGVMYAGVVNMGAWRIVANIPAERIFTRALPQAGYTALVSHSHLSAETEAFLKTIPVTSHSSAASSLKFCKVAEGSIDVYPRFGPTMEWDTAAGHAIVEAAGGCVTTPDGKPFLYTKPGFKNGDFVAWGQKTPPSA